MAISKTSGKFVKTGDTLDVKPSSDIKCGALSVVGGCACVALWDIKANTDGTLKVLHTGDVVTVTTDEAIGATNANVAIYLDANGLVTKTATNNTLIGYTKAAVAAADLSFDIVAV